MDERSFSARLDQMGRVQLAQVLRSVGDREIGLTGEVVDAALALCEQVEEFEALGTAQGSGDVREP